MAVINRPDLLGLAQESRALVRDPRCQEVAPFCLLRLPPDGKVLWVRALSIVLLCSNYYCRLIYICTKKGAIQRQIRR